MLARLGQVLCFVALAFGPPANAADGAGETWDCTYAIPDRPDQQLRRRFTAEGNELVQESGGDPYTILQNNEFGIVAVDPYSGMSAHWGVFTGAYVIVIRKPNGELLKSETFMDEPVTGEPRPQFISTQGQCQLVN